MSVPDDPRPYPEPTLDSDAGSPRRDDGLLRVATYNLLHGISMRAGRPDWPAAAETVAALDADLIAVQEVDRHLPRSGRVDQVALLAERTGMHGVFAPALLGDPDTSWTAVPEVDPGGPAYGVGLLSSAPLRRWQRCALPGGGAGSRQPGASPTRPGWDHEPRAALVAEVEVSGVVVAVATAHLSYLPWRGLAQLRVAAAAVAAVGGPAVLLGDLNLSAWAVRNGLRGGWTHARGQPTYPAWRPRVQVDQVMVRGGLRVRDVAVGPPATSDHLPLLATLALPGR